MYYNEFWGSSGNFVYRCNPLTEETINIKQGIYEFTVLSCGSCGSMTQIIICNNFVYVNVKKIVIFLLIIVKIILCKIYLKKKQLFSKMRLIILLQIF